MKFAFPLLVALLAPYALPAQAHEQHGPTDSSKASAAMEEQAFGHPGDPRRVSRTVTVSMDDGMRFVPEVIQIRRGQTVRFKVANDGKLMHEMVIGTVEAIKEHAELMKKFPDMEHDEPNMAHVAPGTTEDIVWQFTRAGEFSFGCLVPGHFEAGMKGVISVRP